MSNTTAVFTSPSSLLCVRVTNTHVSRIQFFDCRLFLRLHFPIHCSISRTNERYPHRWNSKGMKIKPRSMRPMYGHFFAATSVRFEPVHHEEPFGRLSALDSRPIRLVFVQEIEPVTVKYYNRGWTMNTGIVAELAPRHLQIMGINSATSPVLAMRIRGPWGILNHRRRLIRLPSTRKTCTRTWSIGFDLSRGFTSGIVTEQKLKFWAKSQGSRFIENNSRVTRIL